jgi:hypothetical protein
MSGALCHGLCVGVRRHSYRTVPFDDQLRRSSKMAATAAILHFGLRRLEDKRLGWLIQFFCGSLGVTRGRFHLMNSSASHPRWPQRPPSWIWFPSSLLGVTRGRFLSMISSAAHPRWPLWLPYWIWFPLIFSQRLGRLVWFFGASLGVINLHHVPLLPKSYLPYTHRQRPNRGHMPRLALPLFKNIELRAERQLGHYY